MAVISFPRPQQSRGRKPVATSEITAQVVMANCYRLGLPPAACMGAAVSTNEIEIMSGAVGVPEANASLVSTPYGSGLKGHITTASRVVWADRQFIKTSNGAFTGDFTIAVLANPSSSATIKSLISQRQNSGSFNQVQLLANATGVSPSPSAGYASFFLYQNSATQVSAASMVDGNYHLFMGTRSGSNLSLYVDGVLRAGPTSTSVAVMSTVTSDFVLNGLGESTSYPSDATIPWWGGWNDALNYAQASTVATRWAELLAPPVRKIFVDLGAAPGGTPYWVWATQRSGMVTGGLH